VRLSEAPSHGLPIFEYDQKSVGSRKYMELAREIESNQAKEARGVNSQPSQDGQNVQY